MVELFFMFCLVTFIGESEGYCIEVKEASFSWGKEDQTLSKYVPKPAVVFFLHPSTQALINL